MANYQGANTVETLNGNFKEVYADKINDLVTASTKFINGVKFVKGDKQLGGSFNEAIIIGLEQGFTYGGSEGASFELKQAIASTMKNASVKGYELVLRSAISVGAASRAVSNKNSFERATKLIVGNMKKSMDHRLEIAALYGQQGIATVASVSGANIVIKESEWAPYIWLGMVGAKLDIVDPAIAAFRTNSEGVTITGVDLKLRRITLSATVDASVVADDVIFFHGAVVPGALPEHKEQIGLHKIATTVGSLFGINNTNEPLFQGNIVDVGTNVTPAVLSFDKAEEAMVASAEKGLSDQKLTLMCSLKSWKNLLVEQSAKRQYDSSYSAAQVDQGAKKIMFYGITGDLEIQASGYIKEGHAYVYCEDELIRVGSTDVTFDPPGYEGEFFRMLENHNGYELRAYSDQALFTTRPSCITHMRYIANA
jgi:hypothetical protein